METITRAEELMDQMLRLFDRTGNSEYMTRATEFYDEIMKLKNKNHVSIGNKVQCPYCKFEASAHDSMIVHFATQHPGGITECPPASAWITSKK